MMATDYTPLLLLGAGASRAFGIPTMPEFLSDDWQHMDAHSTAGALAVRRSLELHEVVDLEEVMFLLDLLAKMRPEDPIATTFLKRVHAKYSALKGPFGFDALKRDAQEQREAMRRLIYAKCNEFDRDRARHVYTRLLTSLYNFTKAERLYVVTTNYDRIIEHLWEDYSGGLHAGRPALELQTGFFRPPYGMPVLDVRRGYAARSESLDAVVHLIKVHGSLGWRQYEEGVVRETGAREYPEDFAVLAYPLRVDKSATPPFHQLFGAFDEAVAQADLIVVIGMSLRDKAVVNRLADTLRGGSKLGILIDPNAEVVRNALPVSVRKHMAVVERRLGDDFSPTRISDWEELVVEARGQVGTPPN